MIKRIITILLFSIIFIINTTLCHTQTKIDSLETKLNTVTGKEKVDVLNELSKAYFGTSPEKILEFANQALELSEELDYNKGIAKALNIIGSGYYYLSNHEKTLEYYLKSLEIYKDIGDKFEIAASINNIGNVYYNLSNYNRALEYYLRSLKIFEDINDKKNIGRSSNNIGNIYSEINNYDKAIEYYLKSLKITEEIKDKKRIANVSNNIGNFYSEINNYDKAFKYLLKSLEIYEDIGDKYGIASSLINIGNTYWGYTNYEKSLEYYLKSLEIYREIGNKIGIISSLINIGDVYIKLQNYDKASIYIEQSLKLAEDIEAKELITHSYIAFSDLYSAKNNYKKSLKYYKLYSELKDSIFTEDMSKKIAEMQTKYETEKKEKEIELLQKNNLIYKLEIEKHKLERWLLYLVLIIILVLLFIIYYFYNIKKKANQILEKLVDKRTKELQIEIIERKLIYKSLRKSEEKYRTLIETIDEGVGNVDENENFTFVNKAAANIFGCSKEDLIGKNLKEFTSKEEFKKVLIQTSLRKQRKSGNYELSIKRKDGAMRVIYVTSTSIIRSDGEYKGAFGIFHDVTEQKKMQDQLIRSERLADVGKLAAGIAHEIRNPLGTISAATQLYLGKYKLNKEQKELLEIILRNCEDANKVIKELINFTNPREISLELKDIGNVIDNILKHLYAVSRIHKIQIIKNCPKILPKILLDKKWFETAFANCIINAFDSMPDGGDVTITVLPDYKNNEILITILDTGAGISKENLDKIFDPFFTTKKEGTGLGLLLVHKIIQVHNGKINIESKVGKGTKVIISLPIPVENREKKRIEPQTNTDKK